jgi:SAM-dependent methyltransferase
MRGIIGKVLRGCARPLGLARSPRPGREYWERRARQLGRRSVLNTGHPEGTYHEVTLAQKRELLPQLSRCLRGDERLVLDVGCGPGRFTRDLAALVGGRAIGLDVVQSYLDVAPPDPCVEYRLMREGVLDLPDACADVVWVCLVLGGIDGAILSQSVAEISRVLKPAGLLFLAENTASLPDSAHWKFRSAAAYQALFPSVALEPLHEYVDLDEIVSVLAGRKR